MTLLYVVLCDLAGETFPVCVCPTYFEAQQMVNRMQYKATIPANMVGDYRVNFRVAEAPFADINDQSDAALRAMDFVGRRAIKLEGKL